MALYQSDGLRIATYANGISGRGISEIKNYYYASSSDDASTLPDLTSNNWKEKISNLNPSFDGINKYLWNYEKITYTKIETDTKEPDPVNTDPIILGTWGKGFDNIYEYYIITNTDAAPDLPQQNEDGTWPDQYEISNIGIWIKEKADVNLPKPTRDKPYLWNYEVLNFNDATDQYFGPTCIGTYGNSISQTVEYYYATNTRTPVPSRYSDEAKKIINTSIWKTDISSAGQSATTPFLWNFERTSFSLDEPQDTSVSLISSEPRSIEYITEYYQISATKPSVGATQKEDDENHNQAPTIASGWSDTKPDLDQGETLWNFEVIKYAATDSNGKNLYKWTEPTSVGYMGLDGTSFTGIARRYKATASSNKPTDTPNKSLFDSWSSTPTAADFSATNKYLWFFEKISTSEKDNYTPIELSAIWSQDGRQYEESKYFYLVNNSAGSYTNVDVNINSETGEPSQKTDGNWKSNHGELSKGQALWVAEYQKFSRPATGQTKVWEPLPVRLLSYVGADGLNESGVSLTTSSYIAKSTDPSPIHVERNLYGDATATGITWKWYAKVGTSQESEITSTATTNNIYTTNDKDDIYIKVAAFGSADTIQIRIAGTKTGSTTPIYQDYTTLKMVEDGSDAYVAFLTNPHAGMSADKNGNVSTSTQISTEIVVMKGSVPQPVTINSITSDYFTIGLTQGTSASPNAKITATAKAYQNKINLGSTESCSGVINITITSPISQTLSFNWSKTNTGEDGLPAKDFNITADSYIFAENASGAISGSIIFTAVPKNLSNPTFCWNNQNGSYSNTATTYKLLASDFGTGSSKIITCYCKEDGKAFSSDSITIYRVPKGTKGDKGEAALTIGLTNGNMTFNIADANATEKTSVIAYSGSTQINYTTNPTNTGGWQYKIIENSSYITVTTSGNNAGQITVKNPVTAGENATLSITIEIYYNGSKKISKALEINCSPVKNGASAEQKYIYTGFAQNAYPTTPPDAPAYSAENDGSDWSITEPSSYYVFRSEQTVINNTIDSTKWSQPVLIKENGKAVSSERLKFLELTNGGDKLGVFGSNNDGYLTVNATYIQTGELNADLITAGTLNADLIKAGTLNADLIKAGTFSVGSEEKNNLKFRASIKDDEVKIGGFTVIGASMQSETDENHQVYLGTDQIQLGKKFSVTNEGVVEAKEGSFTGTITAIKGSFTGTINVGDDTKNNDGVGLVGNSDGLVAESLMNPPVRRPIRIYAGAKTANNVYPFMVLSDGSVYATAAKLDGEHVILSDRIIFGSSGTIGSFTGEVNNTKAALTKAQQDLLQAQNEITNLKTQNEKLQNQLEFLNNKLQKGDGTAIAAFVDNEEYVHLNPGYGVGQGGRGIQVELDLNYLKTGAIVGDNWNRRYFTVYENVGSTSMQRPMSLDSPILFEVGDFKDAGFPNNWIYSFGFVDIEIDSRSEALNTNFNITGGGEFGRPLQIVEKEDAFGVYYTHHFHSRLVETAPIGRFGLVFRTDPQIIGIRFWLIDDRP